MVESLVRVKAIKHLEVDSDIFALLINDWNLRELNFKLDQAFKPWREPYSYNTFLLI